MLDFIWDIIFLTIVDFFWEKLPRWLQFGCLSIGIACLIAGIVLIWRL
jgi:hypothetical protein